METYRSIDPTFVDNFLSSIYVDDVSLGSSDIETTYELYLKSKSRLAEAGFKLRKFVTNSDELRRQISVNEQSQECRSTAVQVTEEDQSYKGITRSQDGGGPWSTQDSGDPVELPTK